MPTESGDALNMSIRAWPVVLGRRADIPMMNEVRRVRTVNGAKAVDLDGPELRSCWVDRDLLSAYFDNELFPDVQREVSSHVSGCESCTETLDAFRTIRKLLRAADRFLPRSGARRAVDGGGKTSFP